ncbi:MAG: hypothetical protein JWO89_2802 [Verrucomicrobiaceae bacterium]|nr:hypothetical protein [Verrucomicrobiaceae bacterium]
MRICLVTVVSTPYSRVPENSFEFALRVFLMCASFLIMKKPGRVFARRAMAALLGLMGLTAVDARAERSAPVEFEIAPLPPPPPWPVLEVKIGDEWRTPTTRIAAWGTSDLARRVPVGLEDVVAVAAGETQALALKSDGTMVGWTDADYRTGMEVPQGLTGVVAIAACYAYSEAVLQDGTVVHWGDAVSSRAGSPFAPPRGLTGVKKIAAAGAHSVALMNDGTVTCWGDARFHQTNVPAGLADVTAVAAGAAHSLALKSDGTVVAWGSNQSGEATVPRDLGRVIAIAAGSGFSLALQADGTVRVWGVNGYDLVRVPAGLTGVVQIAAAGDHSLALKSDGTVVAWGAGGLPSNLAPTGPDGSPKIGGVQALVAGNNFNAAIVSSIEMDRAPPGANSTTSSPPLRLRNPGSLPLLGVRTLVGNVAEGSFSLDEVSDPINPLGIRQLQVRYTPTVDADSYTRLQIMTDVTQRARDYTIFARFAKLGLIDAQGDAVSTTGATKVVAWGQKDYGEGSPPADLTNAVSIAAGGNMSMALRSDGTVTHFGWYNSAPPYPGSPPDEPVNIRAIAAGDTFYLGLTDEGTVVQRGGGDTALIPKGLSHVAAIAAGSAALALKQDGTVVIWGDNPYSPYLTPPKGLKEVTAIATGDYGPTLAVKLDGTVVSWGMDNYADAAFHSTKPPKGLANVKAVAAGRYHALALKFDGTVVAWGENDPWAHPEVPGLLDVPQGLSGVTAIAANIYHSAALKADGTMVCWGPGYARSAVVPPRLSGVTAIATGVAHTLALTEGAGTFVATPVLQSRSHELSIRNDGTRLLENVLIVISGRDADEFKVTSAVPSTVGYNPAPFTLTFTPRRPGPALAELKVHAQHAGLLVRPAAHRHGRAAAVPDHGGEDGHARRQLHLRLSQVRSGHRPDAPAPDF